VCKQCGEKFKQAAVLKRHLGTHNTDEEPKHLCTFPGCNKRYLHKCNLTAHMKQHAPDYVPKKHSERPKIQCLHCEFSQYPWNVARHMFAMHKKYDYKSLIDAKNALEIKQRRSQKGRKRLI
jgi:hypothetical protein